MLCVISFYFNQSKLDFCICFFNCQSGKCDQLSHNYIKRDLGNPNFSSTTIVIPRFSRTTSAVHMFKQGLHITVVNLKNLRVHAIIHTLIILPESSYRMILNMLLDSTGEIL